MSVQPQTVFSCCLRLPAGTRLLEAVAQSGILERYPGIEISSLRLGVFGALRDAQDSIRDGDRIEIYQPLKVDAKKRRRLLAKAAAKSGRGATPKAPGEVSGTTGSAPASEA